MLEGCYGCMVMVDMTGIEPNKYLKKETVLTKEQSSQLISKETYLIPFLAHCKNKFVVMTTEWVPWLKSYCALFWYLGLIAL